MRRIPLLKNLPEALAVYFMDDEDMPVAQRRGLNPMEYLSGKISDRVSLAKMNNSRILVWQCQGTATHHQVQVRIISFTFKP